LISTIDVLDPSIPQSETPDEGGPVLYSTHAYGRNRRHMEEWVLKQFSNAFILRLPALFGHGLKKNALYDLIHNNNLNALRSHWQFQWYDVTWLFEDIERIQKGSHRIVNCMTPTIPLHQIVSTFFPKVHISDEQDILVRYSFSSDSYVKRTQGDVLTAMSNYIRSSLPIIPLVSELAWWSSNDAVMKAYLTSKGLGLESVPTKNSWDLSGYLSIYSAQSILYGETIQIFSEQERFLSIMKSIVPALATKGTKVIVFGSPKQRLYSGEDTAFFQSVGDICARHNMYFCIENNSAEYGCTWMTTYKDTIEFVKKVNHPNIRMNLDTGSCFMENEEIDIKYDDIDYIGHIQISFPFLGPWDASYEPSLSKMVRTLYELNYNRAVSLEMKASRILPFDSITEFLKVLRQDAVPFQISQ
jgi:hypothetical protein